MTCKSVLPRLMRSSRTFTGLLPFSGHRVGDQESLMRPFQMFSRGRDFIFPQRRTMHVMRTGLVGRAITNRCITSDQRRAWIGGGSSECTQNVRKIMAIACNDLPARCFIEGVKVLAVRKAGRAHRGDHC